MAYGGGEGKCGSGIVTGFSIKVNGMDAIIKFLEKQLEPVVAAPIPFAVALLLISGAIWSAMQWVYGGIIANRDSTISLLTVQRDDYLTKLKGASPDQAADELKSLKEQLENQKRLLDRLTAHDQLGLYQDGVAVAVARAANTNPMDETITLQMVGSRGPLDMNRTFEFREFTVLCSGQITGNMAMGPQTTIIYNTLVCKIRK
jgi:hypothetical protein